MFILARQSLIIDKLQFHIIPYFDQSYLGNLGSDYHARPMFNQFFLRKSNGSAQWLITPVIQFLQSIIVMISRASYQFVMKYTHIPQLSIRFQSILSSRANLSPLSLLSSSLFIIMISSLFMYLQPSVNYIFSRPFPITCLSYTPNVLTDYYRNLAHHFQPIIARV